jgi:hypothetical protein
LSQGFAQGKICSIRKYSETTRAFYGTLEKKADGSVPRKDPCAAKAFYSCPAIISHRPRSQNTPKESQLNPEKESRIKQARSHVTLEKSS